ncbi:MAG: hypothetical protein KF902_01530 [Phycisphaeraceae bacterium]|nr:hypothetical protein [Phycisphaeraceae bacterium]
MTAIRINRSALDEVEKAFEQYQELLATLEADGAIAPNTAKTYLQHSQSFVRWLKGEFDPGAKNQRM